MEPKTSPSGSAFAGDPAIPAEAPTIILGEPEVGARPPTPDPDAPPLATVGDIIGGRFHLIELIGEGGMSRVYKAIDSQRAGSAAAASAPDDYVAVKVLSRPFNEDTAAFEILRQEIDKLRTLAHPNIVRLLSCDRDDSTVFITMEYLRGRSLYARLHSRTMIAGTPPGIDRDDALSIIAAVAGALEYAHRHLIVHGDLKPGNVIITEVGEIKVIDFGVAGWNSRPRTALERREAAQRPPPSAVTPRYASPQLMARHKPESTDDVYALACLAYELMTGTHPFDDGSGTPALTFPPPLRAGLTPPQYSAVTRGLQAEKRNRTPTVRQFLDEFTAPPRRSEWKFRAAAVTGAVLLGCAAWFYLHTAAPPPAAQSPTAPSLTAPSSAQTPAASPLPVAAPAPAAAPGTMLRDCPTCPQMTVLPTGSFQQGSPVAGAVATDGATAFEQPRHRVTIAYSIAMANRDVTVGDFREFVAATGRDMQGCDIYDGTWRHKAKASWKEPGFAQSDLHPVTCTSWEDAVAYAAWLSGRTGHHYRLPSASEWEYAARAGSDATRPWGTDPGAACANANVADQSAARRYPGWEAFACDDGYVNTAPVSTFKTNAFGLDDMLGNVFQWTQDCWHGDYAGAPDDGTPRLDGDCSERELRGGSWFSAPAVVRPAYRNHFATHYRTSSVGFRLVRDNTP
jgi:formylglycine-generating enzyme required for sulfatase activity